MNQYTQAARDSLAEVAVINAINVPVTLGLAFYLSASALAVFGFIVLLEATGLMFIGGAMDLGASAGASGLAKLLRMKQEKGSDSDEARKKRLRRAVVFVIAGAVLFAESLALALPYI
jgi:hypothetical protein